MFAVLSVLFLITQVTREIPDAARFASWDEVRAAIDPGHPLAGAVPSGGPEPRPPPLTRRERGNLGFLALFTQGLRIVLVSLLVGAFFVALGLLIVRTETIELWTSAPPDLLGFESELMMWTIAPTCLRWAACCTRCALDAPRSRASRSW